jgi:DNA-binding transcriptional LysR family regulator
MPLRSIELFCDVVAHRSFSKAADAWHLSQPAVSQALHQLEENLGVQLIDRSKRPFELTVAGRHYYERCSRLLDEFRSVEDEVQSFGGKVSGRVRVVSIYSVGLLQMKEHVERYRGAYPHVELNLDYAHPDELYARVLRDEADLGIVSFPKDAGEIGCIDWVSQEMVVVAPVDHALAERDSLRISELSESDFVAFSSDLTIRRATDKFLRKQRVSVNIVQQFDNIENIKRAVEIGLGVSLLPLPTIRRELEFGTLHSIPLSDARFERPLGIVHKRHKHLSTAAEKFIELLHEHGGPDSSNPGAAGSKPRAASKPALVAADA